jgi:hypothetical protein
MRPPDVLEQLLKTRVSLLASPRGKSGRLKAAKAKRRVDDLHQQRCQDVAIAPVRGLLAHPEGQNAVARPQNKDASGKGQLKRDRFCSK